MDNVGIIKQIDDLGRICIPKEIRDRLALNKSVELIITDKGVLIRNLEYKLIKKKN